MANPDYWRGPPEDHYLERTNQRRRKRNLFIWLLLISLITTAFIVYGINREIIFYEPVVEQEAGLAIDTEVSSVVPAEVPIRALVKPVRLSQLSLPVEGIVKEIMVSQGDIVERGQTILALDNTREIVALAQAQSLLEQAKRRMDELQEGKPNQNIVAAEAAVDAAQARLNSLTAGVKLEDEAAALAKLEAAQASLEELLRGPSESVLTEAQADLQNAESALRRAQNAYNAVKWRNDIAMLPESQELEQATINYERARAKYQQVIQGASETQIGEAQAQVATAEAELERVRNPVSQSDIDAATAEVRQAKANLELVKDSLGGAASTLAEAEVANARVALLEAEVALNETRLTAPFPGVIGELYVELGEFIESGQAVVEIGDAAAWQLVAQRVAGEMVANFPEDAEVAVKIDSEPELTLMGSVSRIRQSGTDSYDVMITLAETDPRLNWNMTAEIYLHGPQ